MADVPLPLLQRREVEATILGPILRDLMERFGRDEVAAVVRETVEGLAREHGEAVAATMDGNSMSDLRRVLDMWNEGGALETDILRADDEHLEFNVTRCRFAEMYERLGLRELGPILSCNRDFCFVEGFNPAIGLERTQTIMQGAGHCDFRFRTRDR